MPGDTSYVNHRASLHPWSVSRSLSVILLAGIAAASASARPGDWATFMDGTIQTGTTIADGQIWVSSTGGATGFSPGDSTYTRRFRNDGLPAQDLTAMAADGEGNVWFASRAHGLQAESADGRFLVRPLDQFDLGSDSTRVLLAVGDRMWVGTASGAALVAYPEDPSSPSSGVISTLDMESFLGQTPNVSAIAARADTTWFGTQRGVVRREPDGTRALVNDGLTDLDVRALTVTANGELWAGTAQSGTFRWEGGGWVAQANGLPLNRPYQAFVEFEGALHVGSGFATQPVYRLSGLTWSARANGLTNLAVAGFSVLDGVLYAPTTRGLYILGANNVWRRLPSPDPPAPGRLPAGLFWFDVAVIAGTEDARAVNANLVCEAAGSGFRVALGNQQGLEGLDFSRLLIDRQGRNWLGHCCCGTGNTCRVDRLDELTGTATPVAAYDALALAEGPDGRIWIGSVRTEDTPGLGLYVHDPVSGTLDHYTQAIGLASPSIESLAFDDQGQLCIGYTARGMDVWVNPGQLPATIRHFEEPQGLPGAHVTAIAAGAGRIWVGTTAGIATVEGTLVTGVVPGSALPSPLVRDLAIDGCGRVWAATIAGVAVIDPDDGAVLEVYDDARSPGVVDERVNALAVELETGSIWFATDTGLSRHTYDRGCASVAVGEGDGCTQFCPYPNPFDPGRSATLYLSGTENEPGLEVTILDTAGREVRRVTAGADGAVWDGLDASGEPVASGVYLLRVGAPGIDPADLRRVAVRR